MPKTSLLELNRIIQGAALAKSTEEHVQLIVDAVSDVIATDVCSLYRQTAEKDMELVASHGLAKGHPIIIPANQGLVGRVTQSRHSINVINPASLPDYYFVGVLVVQSRRAESLATEQEAFLTTLATHLALLLASLPTKTAQQAKRLLNDYRLGISGAPGIAIGKASVRQAAGLNAVKESNSDNIDAELAQWLKLKSAVIEVLKHERQLVEQSLGDNLAAVIDAYQLLLEDPGFGTQITEVIKTGKTLTWALKQAVNGRSLSSCSP